MGNDFRLESRLLRLPEVLTALGLSKSTWYAGVKAGSYPKPVKPSPGTAAWPVEDIYALMDGMKAAR